jgi:glycosyltransferase involved in cell wall biosynthesis
MDEPLVSIIINNYNYGHYIGQAIHSALTQTYPHTEVIVVDDGSTDDSRKIIASYGSRIIPVLKENGGQASAFNAGFAASKGDIICLLDSDDVFISEKVTEVVKVFKSHQNIGWCFHPLCLVDTNSLVNTSYNTFIGNNPEVSSREIDFRADIKNGKLPTFVPATSGLCFSRSLLNQIFPMPEAEGVSISDLYVKYIALALSKGCILSSKLAIQGVHSDNAYTCKATIEKQKKFAVINTVTAYWMKVNFPVIARTANKLFAKGLGSYLRTGNFEDKYKKTIKNYLANLSFMERYEIIFRAVSCCLKLWIRLF